MPRPHRRDGLRALTIAQPRRKPESTQRVEECVHPNDNPDQSGYARALHEEDFGGLPNDDEEDREDSPLSSDKNLPQDVYDLLGCGQVGAKDDERLHWPLAYVGDPLPLDMIFRG